MLYRWIAIALSSQVSVWITQDYLGERAKRGSWEQFQQVLMKVPDVKLEEFDKLEFKIPEVAIAHSRTCQVNL